MSKHLLRIQNILDTTAHAACGLTLGRPDWLKNTHDHRRIDVAYIDIANHRISVGRESVRPLLRVLFILPARGHLLDVCRSRIAEERCTIRSRFALRLFTRLDRVNLVLHECPASSRSARASANETVVIDPSPISRDRPNSLNW
ncbi:MAG TPA: hypothetical protein VF534_19225 [Paraburkholderia sp.]